SVTTARRCAAICHADSTTAVLQPEKRGRRHSSASTAPRSKLVLTLRHTDRQSVELFGDLDLAREAAVWSKVLREVRHRFFHVLLARQLGKPLLVDVNMAGRACTSAAAIRVDAWYEVLYRALHDRPALGHLDLMLLAAVLDVSDLRHGRSLK